MVIPIAQWLKTLYTKYMYTLTYKRGAQSTFRMKKFNSAHIKLKLKVLTLRENCTYTTCICCVVATPETLIISSFNSNRFFLVKFRQTDDIGDGKKFEPSKNDTLNATTTTIPFNHCVNITQHTALRRYLFSKLNEPTAIFFRKTPNIFLSLPNLICHFNAGCNHI